MNIVKIPDILKSAGYFFQMLKGTKASVLNNPVKIGKINTVCFKITYREQRNASHESIFKAGE